METQVLYFQLLSENAYPPVRATSQSAGYDLHSAYDYAVGPRDKQLIKADLALKIPDGCYGRIAPRSGLALNYHIDIGAGVVDTDYRGNVGVILFNHSSRYFNVKKGDRVAQLICEKIIEPQLVEVKSLDTRRRRFWFYRRAMDAAGPSMSSTITFSLRDMVQFLFMQGFNKIIYWEEALENLKPNILKQPSIMINIYFIFYNAVQNFFINEDSQAKIVKEKERIFSLDELIDIFNTQISDENFKLKSIPIETTKAFKNLLQCHLDAAFTTDINDDESVSKKRKHESDTESDDEDEFEKAFSSFFDSENVKKSKKIKNSKFEQSFHLQSNNNTKWIKTPGEEGKYLVEIRMWDTADIKKIPSDQWWQKVNKKVKFVSSSSSDPVLIATNNLMKLAIDRLKK